MTLTARSFYLLLSVDDVRRESHSTFYLGRHADFVILIQLVLQNLVQFWAGMYKLDGKDTVQYELSASRNTTATTVHTIKDKISFVICQLGGWRSLK